MARKPGGALDQIAARARDLRPALDAIGAYLTGKTIGVFQAQERGGIKWAPRSVPNAAGILSDLSGGGSTVPARRWEPRPAGIDTSNLRNSISWAVATPSVVVGSTVAYASDVQLGGKRTIPIPPSLARTVRAWIKRLKGARKDAAGRRLAKPLAQGALVIDVPPRPYLVVTPEDRRRFQKIAREHVLGASVR